MGISLDYPWMVTVTLACADTLTGGGGRVVIPGLSMDGHGYSGIRGYSDKGGGGRVDIPGLSMDGHSYSGIRGYSDKGGGGRVVIPGLSVDGHGCSGIHGYSDKGGGRVNIPGLSMDGHSYSGMRGYSDKGGGRVDIPGLSMDGHCYSGIRGYSDRGGRVDIPGLSMDGHCYSGIRGYSDKGGGEGWTSLDYPWMVTVTPAYGDTLTWRGRGGKGGHPWTIHGWSQLLPAKYKATVSIHGWQRIVYGTIGHICLRLLKIITYGHIFRRFKVKQKIKVTSFGSMFFNVP